MPARKLDSVDSEALRLIVEGTASKTGPAFFRALVRNLASAMNTAGAWVTEYLPRERELQAHAFWLDGRFIEPYRQSIDGSPCEAIITDKKLLHYPERLGELYPKHSQIRTLGVESYLGVPLLDVDDSVMGHLAVLDTKPLPGCRESLALFEIFAARAAAEQRRLQREKELRAKEEELSGLLESAMDAILLLDEDGRICRTNSAAERMFGCHPDGMCGECFRQILPADGARRFEAFLREIDATSNRGDHVWIPRDFLVQRRDRSVFPAEATLSRFAREGRVFYTLILRNVDERLAAERRLASMLLEQDGFADEAFGCGVIGGSPVMRGLFQSVERVAGTDSTVLVFGETGTGKEMIARSIHEKSRRKGRPLVRVNCAAIPAALMESEFFGHERGAFTGATMRREGRFSLADGGTIFLDEIGELPLDLQSKLLRVLQEGEFESLGSTSTRKVDVRVIAATNRDLAVMVGEGTFREDLFYRLNVFPIHVPPLRERMEDIAELAGAFISEVAGKIGCPVPELTGADVERLRSYRWPGNVRELRNVIERAIILAADGRLALNCALPADGESLAVAQARSAPRILTAQELEALERTNLERALVEARGKVSGPGGVAERLGMPASTVSSRLKALGIPRRTS